MVSNLKLKERTMANDTKVQRKMVLSTEYIPGLMMPEKMPIHVCTCVRIFVV
jgi:hypothetical protein